MPFDKLTVAEHRGGADRRKDRIRIDLRAVKDKMHEGGKPFIGNALFSYFTDIVALEIIFLAAKQKSPVDVAAFDLFL